MRRVIAFGCGRDRLAGTLDAGHATTGLLIVSGGNEIRCGAHRGMAMLAATLAKRGTPVFRYDRRGIGDSEGTNGGFRSAEPDLRAAIDAFRHAAPHMTSIVGFGNCDAASTLAMFGQAAGLNAVVLANPWVVEPLDDLPPAAAIRARYATGLRDPATWRRLVSGRVDFRKLWRGLRRVSVTPPRHDGLADDVLGGIDTWGDAATILLAKGDATAIAFADAARRSGFHTLERETASHSFAGAANADWLAETIGRLLDGYSAASASSANSAAAR